VHPIIGCSFTAEEDKPGGQKVVIISNALWMRAFGTSTSVLGHEVLLDGRPFSIIGVMPAGFQYPVGANGSGTQHIELTQGTRLMPRTY
jgi:putative ABC transport system permease protein